MAEGIAVSMDAGIGVEVLSVEDPRAPNGRLVQFFPVSVRLRPRTDPIWVALSVSNDWWYGYRPEWHRNMEREAAIKELACISIGEHLDQIGFFEIPDEKDHYSATVELSSVLRSIQKREPADDRQVWLYLGALIYWSTQFRWPRVIVGDRDLFRLKIDRTEFLHVVRRHEGVYWNQIAMGGVYEPTRRLLDEFEVGLFPFQEPRPLFQVQKALSLPRYEVPRHHHNEALEALRSDRPNLTISIKQMIDAVESLAKMVTRKEKQTLGECIATLRQESRIPQPLHKAFEAISGFRGQSPGIGHGGVSLPNVSSSEARFVINLAAAAILYLIELDEQNMTVAHKREN